MKKFTIKVIALVVVVICTLSAYCIPMSAVEIVHQYSNRMYTLETLIPGRSTAIYAQIMGGTLGNSTIKLQSYCVAPPANAFTTVLEHKLNSIHFTTIQNIFTSDTVEIEDETQNVTLQHINSIPAVYSAQGYVAHTCTSKTNSSDNWRQNYLHQWSYDQGGWQPYNN